MNISSCMKRQVVSIPMTTTIREAAAIIVKKHVGLLPVVDKDDKLMGVVGLHHLLTLELPNFVNLVADVDFVHDFGAAETQRPPPEILEGSINPLVQPVITVDEDCGLLRAYALMLQQNLPDLPVVSKDGRLIGIASQVDVGSALLSEWEKAGRT